VVGIHTRISRLLMTGLYNGRSIENVRLCVPGSSHLGKKKDIGSETFMLSIDTNGVMLSTMDTRKLAVGRVSLRSFSIVILTSTLLE
jgi:hypothetical protein